MPKNIKPTDLPKNYIALEFARKVEENKKSY